MLIDTHAHLFYEQYADQMDAVLARAAEAGVGAIICVGLDLETSRAAIALAERYPNMWATVGVHPHDAKDAPPDALERLAELARHPRVVAVGETGLDYYRNLSPPEVQRDLFRGQLALAGKLNLPVVVHNREADEDVLAELRRAGHEQGVVHCFSSAPEVARQVLELGFHISFTGTVTFGKNHNEAVLQEVGLERVMVETDCPYLSPVPRRGKTNEPAYLAYTAGKIGAICGLSLDEVARRTTATALGLFTRLEPVSA